MCSFIPIAALIIVCLMIGAALGFFACGLMVAGESDDYEGARHED